MESAREKKEKAVGKAGQQSTAMGESETKAITIKQTRQFASTLGLQKMAEHTQTEANRLYVKKKNNAEEQRRLTDTNTLGEN